MIRDADIGEALLLVFVSLPEVSLILFSMLYKSILMLSVVSETNHLWV